MGCGATRLDEDPDIDEHHIAILGMGDWGLGPIPNPQSPIPNPQSPYIHSLNYNFFKN